MKSKKNLSTLPLVISMAFSALPLLAGAQTTELKGRLPSDEIAERSPTRSAANGRRDDVPPVVKVVRGQVVIGGELRTGCRIAPSSIKALSIDSSVSTSPAVKVIRGR